MTENTAGRGGGRGGGGRGAGGGGRGRGGGPLRGGGGRGDGGGSNNGRREFFPANFNEPSEMAKRKNRKAAKRDKQLQAMQKKADAEDAYFRQCMKDAALAAQKPSAVDKKAKATELFGKQGAQGINFSKYDEIKVEVKPAATATVDSFDSLEGIDKTMMENICNRMHYTKTTPIQRHAIPLALAGQDLMCCAQTGSGKTCAFLLPICVSLLNQKNGKKQNAVISPKCLVLAPTRELASQIELEAQKLTFDTNIRTVCVYGGADQRTQLRALAFGADIIVATPGRLTDFVERNLISLAQIQYLVLDEADRMLDMGFEPQIRRIVLDSDMTLKQERKTLMFSATFPNKIQVLASDFLRPSYTWIAVGRVGSTTDNIQQVLVRVDAENPNNRNKLKLTVEAIEQGPSGRTLIFVQKKRTATWLKKQLSKGGPDDDLQFTPIAAVEIHGDRTQPQRESALNKFRSGECRVLVATDVAARGLDIGGVEHVINMDLPTAADEFDSYVHRIGRTGRAGHTGLATSLYVPGDAPKVGNGKIASLLRQHLKESGADVPEWLEQDCMGGRAAKGVAKQDQAFGGTDVRSPNDRQHRKNNNKKSNSQLQQQGESTKDNGATGEAKTKQADTTVTNNKGGKGKGVRKQGNSNKSDDDANAGTQESKNGQKGGRGRGRNKKQNDDVAGASAAASDDEGGKGGASKKNNENEGETNGAGDADKIKRGKNGRGRGGRDNKNTQSDDGDGGGASAAAQDGSNNATDNNDAEKDSGNGKGRRINRGGRGRAGGRNGGGGRGDGANNNDTQQVDGTPKATSGTEEAPGVDGEGGPSNGNKNNNRRNSNRGGAGGRGGGGGRRQGGRGRGRGRGRNNNTKEATGATASNE